MSKSLKYNINQIVYAKVSIKACIEDEFFTTACVKKGDKLRIDSYKFNGKYLCQIEKTGDFVLMKTSQLTDKPIVDTVFLSELSLNELKGKKVVVHCPTEELAKQVLMIFHNNGMKWRGGQSYAQITDWNSYASKTCYSIDSNTLSDIEFYQRHLYTIISAEDFLKTNSNNKTVVLSQGSVSLNLPQILPSSAKPKSKQVYSDDPTLQNKIIYGIKRNNNKENSIFSIIKFKAGGYSILNMNTNKVDEPLVSTIREYNKSLESLLNFYTYQGINWYYFNTLSEATEWLVKNH